MKRTLFNVLTALFIAALVLACGSDFEPTRPDLGDIKSAYDPSRTGNYSFSVTQVYTNMYFALPGSLDADVNVYELDFNQGTGVNALIGMGNTGAPAASPTTNNSNLNLDLMKITDRAQFEAQLKKTVIFSSYGDDQDEPSLKPATRTPLNYKVNSWKSFKAEIEFTDLSAALSNTIEVTIDPAQFTHHGGIRFDVNNDGVFDVYDTVAWQIALDNTTSTPPAIGYYIEYNPQRGLFTSGSANPIADFTLISHSSGTTEGIEWPEGGSAVFKIKLDTVAAADTTDYASGSTNLNSYYKLQKFARDKGWQNTGINAAYDTTDKQLVFALAGANNGDRYRIRFVDYEGAMKNFKTGIAYNGIQQKLFGTWSNPTSGISLTYTAWQTGSTPSAEIANAGDVFAFESLSFDGSDRNGSFVVQVKTAFTGDQGLPDPAAAIRNGTIKIGYYSGTLNWNRVVYFPAGQLRVETYREDGQDVNINAAPALPANRWRITLPGEYKRQRTGNNVYFFINDEFKTLGDSSGTPEVMQFGNMGNTTNSMSFYREYFISSQF